MERGATFRMSIPLLIESIGPCESSWVRRRDFKRIRVQGLNGGPPILVRCDMIDPLSLSEYWKGSEPEHPSTIQITFDGDHDLFDCEELMVKYEGNYPVSVDLVE